MTQQTESESDPLVGSILGERYRILRLLGEGGMGRVYEGRHTLIKRRVAIKILKAEVAADADFVERFLNEGRLAGTLGHPHIVESTDMGHADDGAPFLVYEYLEGESLATTIGREGRLAARRVATMGIQLASALRAAHAAGIVHRDVKPENIHRDTREGADFCTILDFGISNRSRVRPDAPRSAPGDARVHGSRADQRHRCRRRAHRRVRPRLRALRDACRPQCI